MKNTRMATVLDATEIVELQISAWHKKFNHISRNALESRDKNERIEKMKLRLA